MEILEKELWQDQDLKWWMVIIQRTEDNFAVRPSLWVLVSLLVNWCIMTNWGPILSEEINSLVSFVQKEKNWNLFDGKKSGIKSFTCHFINLRIFHDFLLFVSDLDIWKLISLDRIWITYFPSICSSCQVQK